MNKNNFRVAVLLVMILFIANCSNLISQSGWYQLNSGTNIALNSVSFVNDYTGFMVGSGIAIKTTNGGFNWLIIPTLGGGTSIKFVNSTTGYAANSTVLKTTDGGLSWSNKNLSNLKDISFIDANTGYAVGDYSSVIKTTDGGTTWTNQNVGFAYNDFKSVTFVNANTGIIVGGKMLPPYGAVVYKTVNGGTTWTLLNVQMLNAEFRSVCFPSASIGYIVGGDLSSESGVIFKSTDGGDTWVQVGVTNRDLNSVYFVNSNTGYIAGNGGLVLKTTDGSILWVSQLSNTTKDLNSVFFTRPEVGFTAGLSGDIQKTLLGGNQGPPFSIEGRVTYNTLTGSPVPNAKVVALSYNYTTGTISRVDSAVTNSTGYYALTHIPGGDSTDIMAYPNDELTDHVSGFYGGTSGGTIFWANSQTLFPTGSMTNININVFQTPQPTGLRKISGGVFTAIGGTGLADARIYVKVGNTYIKVGSSVNGGAYSDTHLQPGTYDMVCDRMGYKPAYKTVTLTGGVDLDSINFYMTSFFPIGITNQNLYTPKDFALQQNFPNPFNPVTNIRFDIPKQTNVRLSVYDILGREVEVLVNNVLKPGTYKADWHADKYSSGLYFYRLVTEDYADVKKMILVK